MPRANDKMLQSSTFKATQINQNGIQNNVQVTERQEQVNREIKTRENKRHKTENKIKYGSMYQKEKESWVYKLSSLTLILL